MLYSQKKREKKFKKHTENQLWLEMKTKLVEMMHAHVEAGKNTRSAVENSIVYKRGCIKITFDTSL